MHRFLIMSLSIAYVLILGSDGSNPIPTADVYAEHGATPNAWNATGDAH